MKPERKEVYKIIQEMFSSKPMIIFGTGLSCAVNPIFGMNALQEYLVKNIPELNPEETKEWNNVLQKLKSCDLESSLNQVSSKILLKKIVETTGNFVSKFDKNFSNDIFSGEITWPAEIFFKKIITSYSSCIHVATTNYDLLAEYSFEKNKIPFDTGFDGKIFNDLNWTSSHRRMVAINKKVSRRKTRSNFEEIPHIAFYKVHGSLNTFILDNRIIETNLWAHDKPDFIERLIVTPGTSKFEFLHNFRYELLTKFDESVQNHNFFIFLGFGFNDSQITNSAMQNKLFSNKCNGLIITKSSNNNIESFLSKSENLFLICERNGKPEDTIIKHRNFSEDLIIENQQLWDISNFSKIILGG